MRPANASMKPTRSHAVARPPRRPCSTDTPRQVPFASEVACPVVLSRLVHSSIWLTMPAASSHVLEKEKGLTVDTCNLYSSPIYGCHFQTHRSWFNDTVTCLTAQLHLIATSDMVQCCLNCSSDFRDCGFFLRLGTVRLESLGLSPRQASVRHKTHVWC